MKSLYVSSSQDMKLNKVVDLRMIDYKAGITRNLEYPRMLSWDLQAFTEIKQIHFCSC